MKFLSRLLPLFLLAGTLAACTEDIDLGSRRPAPTVVLNCVAGTQKPIVVQVARTIFDSLSVDADIPDAEVILTVNGTPHSTLTYDPTAFVYRSTYTPRQGDRIRIDARTRLGNVWAEETLPRLIPIDKVDIDFRPKGFFNETTQLYDTYQCVYRIHFADPARERNFYFVRIMDEDGFIVHNLDYSKDEVFIPGHGGLNLLDENSSIGGEGGMAFSDELFDGKAYDLRIDEEFTRYSFLEYDRNHGGFKPKQNLARRFQLFSISEGYYRYLSSLFNEDEDSFNNALVKAGLAEPSIRFSNIRGGTGILGTMQVQQKQVSLAPPTP